MERKLFEVIIAGGETAQLLCTKEEALLLRKRGLIFDFCLQTLMIVEHGGLVEDEDQLVLRKGY